jgi:hypothetical protein
MTCEISPDFAEGKLQFESDVSAMKDVSAHRRHLYVNCVLYLFEFRSDIFVYFTYDFDEYYTYIL